MPVEEALQLQWLLPDGALRIVATGVKKDEMSVTFAFVWYRLRLRSRSNVAIGPQADFTEVELAITATTIIVLRSCSPPPRLRLWISLARE